MLEADSEAATVAPSHARVERGPGQSEVVELLQRMRAGDRQAAAVFITRYESKVRRRVRGKLSPSMRRIFDSQDIVSTVGRRLDLYVRSGKLEAQSEEQLWALVLRMANNAVIDKARVFRRLQSAESEDGPFAQALLQRFRDADRSSDDSAELEIDKVIGYLDDPKDRQILSSWLVGIPHAEVAISVQMGAPAVRKRWQVIRARLQERLSKAA